VNELKINLYKVRLSHEIEDRDWDAFLETDPACPYEQTSLWAQVKAINNWHPVRVIVTRGREIVGGAQVLIRQIPLAGYIGYVSKGPVFSLDDGKLIQLVIDKLCGIAREYRIQYLIVHPPDNSEASVKYLIKKGFKNDAIVKVVDATLMIDLSLDLDEIFSNMKRKHRQYIRRGERKGVKIRLGSKEDIGTFYRLMLATCRRQGVSPNPSTVNYINELWHVFNKFGSVIILLAEYNNEVLSALIAIPFGKIVRAWKIGWSGRYGDCRPNYVLYWELIKWAKIQGYSYLDLVGINSNIAKAILSNKPFPNAGDRNVTSFKLGFGGNPVILPDAFVYIYNPLFRSGYHIVLPRIRKWSLTQKMLQKVS
jgi:lipid II:glycine glycyltransferase (peptidoglycan interpeptide bridge formation enzyme)